MANTTTQAEIVLPKLPVSHDQFVHYLADHDAEPIWSLIQPFQQYDAEMRKIFAQNPGHPAAQKPSVVPLFQGHESAIKIHSRKFDLESKRDQECFIMPLADEDRRVNGSPAVVQSLKEFRTNFNVFSESSLVDMDWANVVVAGSAVVTSLLAVPDKHNGSKRALREYYHEKLAPASDVDLFLFGLTEEQAVAKIEQIEQCIRDAILVETTTIRTKNCITIASQYPTRHVQIVLRIYNSISEILTGFDVDCSCAAYDGKQVYASPRAIAAYMTQINTIDLTRRSPSYENRLSKYASRGFEVYWPNLDRSRIDPTIFERSFGRTEGLARLLILEMLPRSRDRDDYLDQRRAERGRPAINRWRLNRRQIYGNIKNDHEDEVAEWVDAEDVSDYHTFTIPYGPRFHARKIERLLYTKDLLLNSEWNRPKDREVSLHRHPAFFGTASDVAGDCCGYCPAPVTMEEEEISEKENHVYVRGKVSFIKDDPGRQSIGSFNPLDANGWTNMAYVGNTEQLCKAIIDDDRDFVESWLAQDGNDPNTRDYTGRAPLHLAVSSGSIEVVQLLIDHGARIIARLIDGKTSLHLAAMHGSVEIVRALLRKSEANEEQEAQKFDARRAARALNGIDASLKDASINETTSVSDTGEDMSDVDMVDDNLDDSLDATTQGSMVNIKPSIQSREGALDFQDNDDAPDIYDVNVLAWDIAVSPLHLAIVNGHLEVVKCLVSEFGADVLLPIKLFNDHDRSARAAILTLVLALQLPLAEAKEMVNTLTQLGASVAQADINQHTVLHTSVVHRPEMLTTLHSADPTGFGRAISHLSASGPYYRLDISSSLMTAINARDSLTSLLLLTSGAKAAVDFSSYIKAYKTIREPPQDSKRNKQEFEKTLQQPIISAVECELPDVAKTLLVHHNVDPNTLSKTAYSVIHDEWSRRYNKGASLLDEVRSKIRTLKEWTPAQDQPEQPIALKDDDLYIADLPRGSYKMWSAQKQLNDAKERYKQDLKRYNKDVGSLEKKNGLAEKKIAVQTLLTEFEQLETVLIERGGKTFAELHPDVKEPADRDSYPQWQPEKPKPFEVDFSYRLPDLTDEATDRYTRLFEATWIGDLETVRTLSMNPWRSHDGENQAPLQLAVQDKHSLSPFSIAVLQGHYEVASIIMELAQSQYVPPDEPKKQKYGIEHSEPGSSENEGSTDEEVHLYAEEVDPDFTVDTVGEAPAQAKSNVKALTMLLWSCPAGDFSRRQIAAQSRARRPHTTAVKLSSTGTLRAPSNHLSAKKSKDLGPPSNLVQFALHEDDAELLHWLLEIGAEYHGLDYKEEDDDAKQFFSISQRDFVEAVKLDRPHLLAELMKSTGAGIPLDQLVRKSGVKLSEKPKHYQGLSVYGRKRKDWADADAGRNVLYQPHEDYRSPLLEAAYHASVDTIEWLLSEAPMRAYKHFARANVNDKRVKALSEAKGGFEAAVSRFLGANSHLAIHCCLLGKPVPETASVLKLLIKAMPDAVDQKSQDGITPLQICFRFLREEAARILIAASADQTARDKCGNNLLHNVLMKVHDNKGDLEQLPVMIGLIDKRLLSVMSVQRSVGALTPLAQWVEQARGRSCDKSCVGDVLRLLVRLSGEDVLRIINGEGNSPIHAAVHGNMVELTKTILELDPTLLMKESSAGRTVFEMAEDEAIASACNDPPPFPDDYKFDYFRAQRQGLPRDWRSDLVKRQVESFVSKERNEKPAQEKMWALLKEAKAKLDEQGMSKRRLVTLNEANEVAPRLAGDYSEYRRPTTANSVVDEDEDHPPEQHTDEVQMWLLQARSWLEKPEDDESD